LFEGGFVLFDCFVVIFFISHLTVPLEQKNPLMMEISCITLIIMQDSEPKGRKKKLNKK